MVQYKRQSTTTSPVTDKMKHQPIGKGYASEAAANIKRWATIDPEFNEVVKAILKLAEQDPEQYAQSKAMLIASL
jgi:hypothetical protein